MAKKQNDNKPEDERPFAPENLAIGIALGVAIGAALGKVAIGLALGVAIGLSMGNRKLFK